MCAAADLPPAACETCVTYFTLIVSEPIARSTDAAEVNTLVQPTVALPRTRTRTRTRTLLTLTLTFLTLTATPLS